MTPLSTDRLTLVRHSNAEDWNESIAREMAGILAEEVRQRGRARMLLSGGTTPAPVYARLAEHPLEWVRVEVGLADERWLSPRDRDSNAWLVRENFLKKKLALTDSDDALDKAIAAVGDRMKGENFRNRVTVYYLLAESFGKLGLFAKAPAKKAAAKKAAPAKAAAKPAAKAPAKKAAAKKTAPRATADTGTSTPSAS